MTIITRARRLISSTIHSLMQRLESPEQIARHSLRELSEAIETCTAAVARSIAGERMMVLRSQQLQREIDQTEQAAAIALAASDEPSTRQALGRKFDLQRSLQSLAEQLAESRATNQSLQDQLAQMRERYEEAKRQVEQGSARALAASARARMAESKGMGTTSEACNLEAALNDLEREALESEAKAELQEGSAASAETVVVRSQRQTYVEAEMQRRQHG